MNNVPSLINFTLNDVQGSKQSYYVLKFRTEEDLEWFAARFRQSYKEEKSEHLRKLLPKGEWSMVPVTGTTLNTRFLCVPTPLEKEMMKLMKGLVVNLQKQVDDLEKKKDDQREEPDF